MHCYETISSGNIPCFDTSTNFFRKLVPIPAVALCELVNGEGIDLRSQTSPTSVTLLFNSDFRGLSSMVRKMKRSSDITNSTNATVRCEECL